MKRYTVAILPGKHPLAQCEPDSAIVTDARDPVPGSPVVGGGQETCDVRFDGEQWIVTRVRT